MLPALFRLGPDSFPPGVRQDKGPDPWGPRDTRHLSRPPSATRRRPEDVYTQESRTTGAERNGTARDTVFRRKIDFGGRHLGSGEGQERRLSIP